MITAPLTVDLKHFGKGLSIANFQQLLNPKCELNFHARVSPKQSLNSTILDLITKQEQKHC